MTDFIATWGEPTGAMYEQTLHLEAGDVAGDLAAHEAWARRHHDVSWYRLLLPCGCPADGPEDHQIGCALRIGTMKTPVEVSVDRDGLTGQLQVGFLVGNGGYRLAGPKYSGTGENLLTAHLDQRAIREILRMLSPYVGCSDPDPVVVFS